MMEIMGYNFTKESCLNFSKGKWALLPSFVPKGKDPNYYHKTRRGLDYVSTQVLLDPESEKEVHYDSSSAISWWDSDVNVGNIFKSLSMNMVSTSYLEEDGEDTFESEKLIQW